MTLNYAHIASVRGLTSEQLKSSAAPVLQALRAIPEITPGNTDPAGIPIRGALMYREAIDDRFTAPQLACARCVLFGADARITVIDALEFATIRNY